MFKKKRSFIFILILFIMLSICGCKSEEKMEYQYMKTELLVLDIENTYIELLGCSVTKYDDIKVLKLNADENITNGSIDDLYIGMENIYIEYDDEKVHTILIDQNPLFSDIRVAIRNTINDISNNDTLYHKNVELKFIGEVKCISFDGTEKYSLEKETSITAKDNKLIINGIKTEKRVLIESDEEIGITSITRQLGIPYYSGRIELKAVEDKILVINEVNMEDYLTKVVPSEMPATWELEALKTQAVAARTYAYYEIYNKSFMKDGYIVDDSESSQVYNNLEKNSKVTQAIEETKGITMFYGENESKLPIKAYYYSSSSGLTASGNEVWIENGKVEEIPFVIGKNITDQEVDLKSEDSVLEFFKTIKMTSVSGASSNHRWHIELTKNELRNMINANIRTMAKKYPESFLVYKNNRWVKGEIHEDIGQISNIRVGERGDSGVVISLIIDADNGSFKIYNQYNIRFTLRPKDAGNDVYIDKANHNSTTYTSKSKNSSILPSGFFAIEWVNNKMHIYGGGLGHGVGMCQYGAHYLAGEGKDYQYILNTFYSNIEFIDTSKSYKPLKDYEKYFN